jgi:DNA-binding transcriptional regulator YhcF (GntR family)
MDISEIKKNFSVDANSSESLKDQLIRRVDEFIKNNPPGAKLPPERDMAGALKISRITVRNALKNFLDNGRLISRGRNGTVIPEKSRGQMLESINPLALGLCAPPAKKEGLKLLLYENIPFQKEFWEKITGVFNERSPSYPVEIEWLLSRTQSEDDVAEHAERGGADIFQRSFSRSAENSARRLPESVTGEFNERDHWLELFSPELEGTFKYMAPISFNMYFVFWNENLALSAGLDNVRERIRAGKLNEMTAEAAGRLPEGFQAYGHIWDRLRFMGAPPSADMINEDFFRKRLAAVFKHGNVPKAYIYRQKSSFEAVELFCDQKLLFLEGAPSNVFIFGKNMPFKLAWEPCPALGGGLHISSAMGLCLSKNSERPAEAAEFIRFMLSKEAQEALAALKLCPPLRRDSAAAMGTLTQNGFEKTAGRYRVQDSRRDYSNGDLSRLLIFSIRDIIADLCGGRISIDEAARLTNQKWLDENGGDHL